MRSASSTTIALLIAAAASAAFGWFAPRVLLLGWLTIVASLAAAALGAAMLVCMLRLGRSRLLDAWDAPLSVAVPWLYVMPVLCLPFVCGAGALYGWSSDAAFAGQRDYLNVPFFVVRLLLYFAATVGVAMQLPFARRPMRVAVLLLIAFVVANIIGIDTIMALTPLWHSSDFGLRWAVDGLLIAASLAVAWHAKRRRGTSEEEIRSRIDGATLLFALDLGWLYLMFVDYVTAWSGNLPDETIWYAPRTNGSWAIVIVAVVAMHVIVGALLLSRTVKRSPSALSTIAALVLAAQWLEAVWTVIPGTNADAGVAIGISLLSIAVLVGASFVWRNVSRVSHRGIAHG